MGEWLISEIAIIKAWRGTSGMLAAGLAMIAMFVDGYGYSYDTNLSSMKLQEGGSDMIDERKWLYAAMALTGGFLGGVAVMEFAPGVAIARIKPACYVRNSSNSSITAAANGPY